MNTDTEQRRQAIREELNRHQAIQVRDLSERYGVSEVSIRRDLAYLEALGVLRRIHGGAIAVRPILAESCSVPEPAMRRAAEKARIGKAGAALISAGERVIFDSGTTVLEVARHLSPELRAAGNLTVITNSLPIVRELGSCPGIHLILLGGVYLAQYEVVVGPQTIEQLQAFHTDKLFLGADGLTLARGVTTANVLEAEVNRATIAASAEVIVVADSTKIGQIGLTTIAHCNNIHKLITDIEAPPDFVAALRNQGVEVIMV